MQFVTKYFQVDADQAKRKLMMTKQYKGDWSSFTRIAITELNTVMAELEAGGTVLVGDGPGRQQAATVLEDRRLLLRQTIPMFFKSINTRIAAENRAAGQKKANEVVSEA